MKKTRWLFGVGGFFLLIFLALPVFPSPQMTPLDEGEIQKMRLISEAYLKMQRHYYREISLSDFEKFFYRMELVAATLMKNPSGNFQDMLDNFVYEGLAGMVLELRDASDSFSRFIHNRYVTQVVRENLVSKFAGIGIEVEEKDKGFWIRKVYEKSSAAEEGILLQDQLVRIDGKELTGYTLKQVESLLNVPSGVRVSLSVIHPGTTQVVEILLTCRIIVIPSVAWRYYEEKQAGYVKVSEFRNETAEEVREALLSIDSRGASGLVLDLRDNDGGDMEQAVALCNFFLPEGKLVCYFLKRDVGRQDQKTTRLPLELVSVREVVVLVNRKTGSAAEITAGALRYHKSYFLLGTQTKGSGSLKNTIPLSDRSLLYLITSRTYLPDGNTFDGVGLVPDAVIEGEAAQLAEALGRAGKPATESL